jgi:hypothetical protein
MLESSPVIVNVSSRNPNLVAATIAGRSIYSTGPAAGKRSCSWSPSIETGATTQKTPASIVSPSRRTELGCDYRPGQISAEHAPRASASIARDKPASKEASCLLNIERVTSRANEPN